MSTVLPPPRHHPSEELLLDYVSAAAPPAESLMIAAHLDHCAECRRAAGDLAAIGGAMLETLTPHRLPPDMLNRTLAAIDRETETPHPFSAPSPLKPVEAALTTGRWRRMPGGYAMTRVPTAGDSGRVWLLKARGGSGLLRHEHIGDEWTVVVQGAFVDETGSYRRGDFVALQSGVEHRPVAMPGEDCICLIMVRQSPRYTTLVGKLAAPFVRL